MLLVEDNDGDARLTIEAFNENHIRHHISRVKDGDAAIAYLRRRGEWAVAPRPDLILLDLNLPRRSGREVLAEIKGDPGLRHIPVVVLTTSKSDEDILGSYDLHANCFITKPSDFGRFIEIVKQVEDFWLGIASLPAG